MQASPGRGQPESKRREPESKRSVAPVSSTQANPKPSPNPTPSLDLAVLEEGSTGHATYWDPSFEYLHVFVTEENGKIDESELVALENLHSRGRQELNELISKNVGLYRVFLTDHCFAVGVEGLSLPSRILTGRDGWQGLFYIASGGRQMPGPLGLAFALPFAIAEMVEKFADISARKEAVKRLIKHINQTESSEEPFSDCLIETQDDALRGAQIAALWGFNTLIKSTHTLCASSMNYLAFCEPFNLSLPLEPELQVPGWLAEQHVGVRLGVAAVVGYAGHRYHSLTSNVAYDENFKNFICPSVKSLLNETSRPREAKEFVLPSASRREPWLWNEMTQGRFALPLYIAGRGLLVSTATHAFPEMFYLAKTSLEKITGLSAETATALASSLSVLMAWHAFVLNYPATYYRCMRDRIAIDDILRNNVMAAWGQSFDEVVEKEILRLERADTSLTLDELNKYKQQLHEKLVQNFIDGDREMRELEIRQVIKSREPFCISSDHFRTEPSLMPQFAFSALYFIFLSFKGILPATATQDAAPQVSAHTGAALGACTLLGLSIFNLAEKQMAEYAAIRERLEPKVVAAEAATTRAKGGNGAANAVTIGANVSRAVSVFGMARRSLGYNQPIALSVMAFFTGQRLLESCVISLKKAQSEMIRWSCFRKKMQNAPASGTRGTLFAQGANIIAVEDPHPQPTSRSWLPSLTRKGESK